MAIKWAAAPTIARRLDIAALIDDAPIAAGQRRVFILCALIAALEGFDLQIAGSLAPVLADALGLPPSSFGPIFAAGFFGIMMGSLGLGAAADRVGRKPAIIAAMLICGGFTLAVPLLDVAVLRGFGSLLVCRFIGGVGIGGVMPNVLALTAEYAPGRSRALIINTMYCGVPLGSVIVGVVTAALVPSTGWHIVFELGGVLPLALAVLSLFALPESARYLVSRGAPQRQVAAL